VSANEKAGVIPRLQHGYTAEKISVSAPAELIKILGALLIAEQLKALAPPLSHCTVVVGLCCFLCQLLGNCASNFSTGVPKCHHDRRLLCPILLSGNTLLSRCGQDSIPFPAAGYSAS
jgi:hypothetical protein